MFYVYILKNPMKDNMPFYVGKGRGERVSFHIKSAARNWRESRTGNRHKSNTIKQILEKNLEVTVEVIYMDNEESAFQKEKELISLYGLASRGGMLTNISLGGEGHTRVGIEVDQYTLFGEYIASYKSIQEASNAVANSSSSKNSIKECCDGLRRSCKGFRWAYKGHSIKETNAKLIKCVAQYDLQGNLVNTYTSVNKAAVSNGFDGATLSQAIKSDKVSYGFKWKHLT